MARRSLALLLAAGVAALAAGCAGGDEEAVAPAAPPAAAPAPAEAAPTDASRSNQRRSNGVRNGGARATAIAVGLNAVGPKIIQEASISLAVEEGGFELAISRARDAALAAGGFVTSSEARQAETEERLVHGKLVVRVPFLRYSAVMSQIIGFGTVEAREEAGRDVSQQFVDLEARGRHLEAVEAQLLGFLDDADSIGDALTVQSRLNEVQLQLEQIRGQLRFLENQTQYATISIAIAERGLTPVEPPPNGWGIVDVWETAADGFVKVAGGAFVGIAAVAPVVGPLVLAFIAWRLLRRRGRRGEPLPVVAAEETDAGTKS